MTFPINRRRDKPHARTYAAWRELAAWKLSCAAKALLVEMMMDYRPGENGRLQWSVRRIAQTLSVSKATAATALVELEKAGWIHPERMGHFGRRNAPSEFALAMFANDVSGEPASRAFEHYIGERPARAKASAKASPEPRLAPARVRPEGHDSPHLGTRPSGLKDTGPEKSAHVLVLGLLKKPYLFKPLGRVRH